MISTMNILNVSIIFIDRILAPIRHSQPGLGEASGEGWGGGGGGGGNIESTDGSPVCHASRIWAEFNSPSSQSPVKLLTFPNVDCREAHLRGPICQRLSGFLTSQRRLAARARESQRTCSAEMSKQAFQYRV